MIRKTPTLAAFALLVFSCSRSGKMQRDQKQYDVVPEGSASGVTSTINGPGETTPPVTNTNADTTTNFTIPANPNPLGNDTAGTSEPITSTTATSPRPLRPRAYTPPPRPQELRPEPATDTTTATTDTETTTTTTPAPNPKKNSDEDQPSPPPPTDTTGTRG